MLHLLMSIDKACNDLLVRLFVAVIWFLLKEGHTCKRINIIICTKFDFIPINVTKKKTYDLNIELKKFELCRLILYRRIKRAVSLDRV